MSDSPRPEVNSPIEVQLIEDLSGLGITALDSFNPDTPAQLTARVGTGTVPAANRRRIWSKANALNWRLYMIRFICAGLAVVITVGLVPGLSFTRWHWGTFLAIAVVFGLLNALVKPILQFLVLRFIFSTYGLVVVLINMLLLWILDRLMGNLILVNGLMAFILGGLGVGLFGTMFETVLGATPPILESKRTEKGLY